MKVHRDAGLSPSRRWAREVNSPSWSVQMSILALIVVGALVIVPSLRDHPLVLILALYMVVASWVNVAVMYAIHYARMDEQLRAFVFQGDESRHFSDYLYLALAVQSTFGTTDVGVRRRRARRAMTADGVLAFVFNSVILAVTVSLVLGIG